MKQRMRAQGRGMLPPRPGEVLDWTMGLCKLEGIALKPLLPKHFQCMLAAATGWDISAKEIE